MGDLAEFYVGDDWWEPKHTPPTCRHCGKRGLKWRLTDNGWRLFENTRIEHNRKKQHVCNDATADDFPVGRV